MPDNRFLALAAVLALATGGYAQTQPAKPEALAFEVASIKPAGPLDPGKLTSGQMRLGLNVEGSRVDIGFLSLSDLIRTAYKIKPYQLQGPDWMNAQRWDIAAKMPEGATKDDVPQMLQALLAERFKLTVHRSTTEHSVYALVVGKNGAKLKQSEPDPAPPDASAPPAKGEMVVGRGENQMRVTPNAGGRGATVRGGKFGQMKMSAGENGTMRMEFSKMQISDLADMISPFLDKPVLDMTDLKGNYQVALDLSMEDLMRVARSAGMGMIAGPAPAAPNPLSSPADAASNPSSSIFTAIQQLGLKLDSRKAPVEMIVIDHLEKTPTEN